MKPLHVTAYLLEGVSLRSPLMLDALLVYAATLDEQRLTPISGEPLAPVEIPIEMEQGGRFHLCSQGFASVERSETRYKNMRAPWHEQARLGNGKVKRIDIASGIDKGIRFPYEVQHLEGNRIEWWCIGDRDAILALLSRVRYIGRFRGSGKGKLDFYHREPWSVEPCEPWGEGFPVVRDGKPTRPLPPDYQGLVDPPMGFTPLTAPYWDRSRVELCAVPPVE